MKRFQIGKGSILGHVIACMLLFFMVFPGTAWCQSDRSNRENTVVIPRAEFGVIPDSLFSMQVYQPDPSAPYFYAFKKVYISFEEERGSIFAKLDYHVRIKVFDSEAREASIIAVPYYFENEIESVQGIRGITHHPDGTQSRLTDDRIRTINLNARYNVKEFTMPDVVDGSVIEYSYTTRRRYIEELPDFYLSHQAPTAVARATIEYPQYLRYEVVPTDFSREVHHVEQRIDTSSVPKVFSIPQPNPLLLHHWIVRDVPAVEERAFISSLDDYRGKLKFQLKEFGIPRQRLEVSWDLVVAQIRKNRNPWRIAGTYEQAQQIGKEIASQFQEQEVAQDSIFRFVNSRVQFNNSKGAYSKISDEKVLDGELVDQAAINQTLLAMLQGGGIDAYPMFISTRPFGRINKSFPSYFQFNSQIVYTLIDGKSYFMDASFPYSFPNLIPVETYNETGLLLRKDSYEWKEIKPRNSIFVIRMDLVASLDRNGNLSGKVRAANFGYPAQIVREKAGNGQTEEQIVRSALFDGYSDIQLENAEIKNLRNFEDSVKMSTNFTIENYATSFTDQMEYRPMVVGYLSSNPFEDGRRDLPVTLDAPEKLDLSYTLHLPSNYSAEQGNQNRSVQLPGASLEERYRSEGQKLRYEYHIDISKKQFEPELYPQLLDLYERWVDLSKMTWQLKKQ